MKKAKVLETVNDLPNEFELDQLVEKLLFIEKVEKGLEQAKRGEVFGHDEIKKMADGWRK